MTETVTEKLAPVDPDALLASLAAYWADPTPDRVFSRIPKRIAGSPHDQQVPDGTASPYWEIIRQLPCDTIENPWRKVPEPDAYFFDPATRHRLLAGRTNLCGTFAWSIPSPGDITWITGRLNGRGVIEPGAGKGYWAWQLTQAGADVIACDPKDPAGNHHVTGEPWFPVLRDDHTVTARHPDRSLLLCWPGYGAQWAEQALAAYKGAQVFYIGEGPGGCCADDGFFSLLDAGWENCGDSPLHVTFSGIHCYLTEYRRRPVPVSPDTGEQS